MVSHFKTNTPKQTLHGTGKKLSKQKIQNIRNPFILRKKKRNLIREKKETNNRLIKDIIIRDIRTLLEEEDYYKLKRVRISGTIIILNIKIMVIKIETYH